MSLSTFFKLLIATVLAFAVITAGSYFALSSGYGRPHHDGIERFGYPVVIWERGGFSGYELFRPLALLPDYGFAVIVTAGLCAAVFLVKVLLRNTAKIRSSVTHLIVSVANWLVRWFHAQRWNPFAPPAAGPTNRSNHD